MSKAYSRVLLVTANVGSIFEDPEKMIGIWMQEFMTVVTSQQPELLAIHCQEVGGKNYEDTMQHVNKFIKMLLSSETMQQFDRARVFLDEDFTAVEKFTALGSLYFIHHSVTAVEMFDFHAAKFVPVEGKEVLSGNIEHVPTKEKAKFAQEFFPDFVWSRKGFIRTRWNLYGTEFDLVNIHLIHDVSNIAAMETSPSTYSEFRVKALLHTIERFETDQYDKVPFFVFGDYNFRLDTNQLVKKLTSQAVEQRVLNKKNDVSKVIFKEQENGKVILTVGKKDFHHHEHNQLFSRHNAMTLQVYDKEPESCQSKLFEYKVTFPPSYPFSEDAEDGTSYMPTRCPGWCDRIMMSHDAPDLFHTDNGFISEYKMMGMHICMGDHKPIYLNLQLRTRASGNESTCTGDVLESADRLDGDSGPITDSTVYTHTPVRHVVSVNGEEEDVEDINIHDFTTFEQEDLIGQEFIGRLKRKSVCSVGDLEDKQRELHRGLSTFRSAVRAVLSTEIIMQAMRHYNHRSDSDTEDDDECRSPAPTETKSSPLSVGNGVITDSCIPGNPNLPVSVTSAQSVQNSEECDSCYDKRSESDTAVNYAYSPSSVEKPDRLTFPMSDSSVAQDSGVELSTVQLVDTEPAFPTRTTTEAESDDTILSVPATLVVDDAEVGEMHVDADLGSAMLPALEATDMSENADGSDNKALLEDVDLFSQHQQLGVSAVSNDSDDGEAAKPTDGLLTPTAEHHQTDATDAGCCRCCRVQ